MSSKIRVIFEQFVKFGVVGLITTTISTCINVVLLKFDISYVVAYSIAYFIGNLASYMLNSFFVFKENLSFNKYLKFVLVYLVSYLVGLFNIMVMVELLHIEKILATLVNVCIMTLFNFIFVKLIAFGKVQS